MLFIASGAGEVEEVVTAAARLAVEEVGRAVLLVEVFLLVVDVVFAAADVVFLVEVEAFVAEDAFLVVEVVFLVVEVAFLVVEVVFLVEVVFFVVEVVFFVEVVFLVVDVFLVELDFTARAFNSGSTTTASALSTSQAPHSMLYSSTASIMAICLPLAVAVRALLSKVIAVALKNPN